MNKYLKYTLRGLGIFAGILLLVYIAAYIYVVANKKDIINQIKTLVAEKLNGEVQIGDIDLGFLANFPSIGVQLENVSIRDTLFNQHKHPFFQAEKVNASISFINLIKKQNPLSGIRVDKGQLYIYTDTSGYTNSYLLAPKSAINKQKTTKSASKTELQSIKFFDVRLVLDNRKKKKLFDFGANKFNCSIKEKDSVLYLKTKNDFVIHSLAFNTDRGSFVEETRFQGDFKVTFDKVLKELKFDDIEISLKDHPFNLTGYFKFSQAPKFAIKVISEDIDYIFARNLLAKKISKALAIVNVEKPIQQVVAEISGPLNGGEPLVNASWKCNDNNLRSPFVDLTNCSFTGSYTNELVVGLPRKDPNSRLQLHDLKGTWQGIPFTSQNIYIDNLQFPMLNCDLKANCNLPDLNSLLGSSTLDFHEGKCMLDINYSGPLQENTNRNTLLNGKIAFSDGLMMYHPRNLQLTSVNGEIAFKNSDVFVNNLRGTVSGNKIIMNGNGRNLLALLKTNPGKILLNWSIYSPALNLNSFTSLLKQRTATKKTTSKSPIGKQLDQVVNQANFRLQVKADALTYQKFKATNVRASLGLVNENWLLNNVSLQHAGGSMAISGSLTEVNSKIYQANVKVDMNNVDVNEVMLAFNNFGQDGIEARNLRGKLTTHAAVTLELDRVRETAGNINGFVDFSLRKGALLHYEPLQKVQNVAFKKRNFDEIYFGELKNHFEIKNREITINRMAIESTVFTLFVDGVYSLRGNTDISIQVPLSNLKKRDENFRLENKDGDTKGGASVFIRGQPGPDGSIQFKLDLFKKFRKTDEEKAEQKDAKEKKDVKAEEEKANKEAKDAKDNKDPKEVKETKPA